MVNIRAALDSLPAKPALVIAPIIVCVVLALYYHQRYKVCTQQSVLRNRVLQSIAKIEQQAGGQFHLADAIPFQWNILKVTQGYRPEHRQIDCPFGWGWPADKRRELARENRLTILAFFFNKAFRGFVELDGNQVEFVGLEKPLGPTQAVFDIENMTADGPVILRLATKDPQ